MEQPLGGDRLGNRCSRCWQRDELPSPMSAIDEAVGRIPISTSRSRWLSSTNRTAPCCGLGAALLRKLPFQLRADLAHLVQTNSKLVCELGFEPPKFVPAR